MEKIKSLPANYIFQAVDSRQIGMMERFYRAADVDALLSDVRRLVEAAIDARELMETLPTLHGFIGLAVLEELKQAIATVERHFESNKNTQIKGIDNQK